MKAVKGDHGDVKDKLSNHKPSRAHGGTGLDQVNDRVGEPELTRGLNGAGHELDRGLYAGGGVQRSEVGLGHLGERCDDTVASIVGRPSIPVLIWHQERQAALAEAELHLLLHRDAGFGDDVLSCGRAQHRPGKPQVEYGRPRGLAKYTAKERQSTRPRKGMRSPAALRMRGVLPWSYYAPPHRGSPVMPRSTFPSPTYCAMSPAGRKIIVMGMLRTRATSTRSGLSYSSPAAAKNLRHFSAMRPWEVSPSSGVRGASA
eukprot:scaffold64414_cov31-Tisochrysis_lutea.AAC.2